MRVYYKNRNFGHQMDTSVKIIRRCDYIFIVTGGNALLAQIGWAFMANQIKLILRLCAP